MVISENNNDDRSNRFLLKCCSIYAVCIGMTSYYGDNICGQIRQTALSRTVALTANIITLSCLPKALLESMNSVGIIRNPLLLRSHIASTTFRVSAVLFVVLLRNVRQKTEWKINQNFMALQANCERIYQRSTWSSKAATAERDKIFQRFAGLKCSFFVYLSLASFMNYSSAAHEQHWYTYLWFLILVNTLNLLNMPLLTNFFAMSYLCKALYCANDCLYEMSLVSLSRRTKAQAEIIKHMHDLKRLHWQLAASVRQLNNTNRYVLVIARLILVMSNVTMAYYGSVFTYSGQVPIVYVLFGAFTFIIYMLDVFSFDALCDLTVRQYRESGFVLKQFEDYHSKAISDLQRSGELFSLQLANCELNIDLCGLFVVDKRFYFRMFAHTASFTILLVQFHAYLNDKKNV